MKKAIPISIWIISLITVVNEALRMISEASTIENIIGFLILVIAVLISIKTKCFTNLKNKKDEKSN